MIFIDFYNIKIKDFDNSHKQIIIYSKMNRYNFSNLSCEDKNDNELSPHLSIDELVYKVNKSAKSSKNRSKNMIYDYARSNEWKWFVTMTFDPKKVDSFDYEIVTKKLSQWLKNIHKRKCPNMKYLFVPELHPTSGRFHFHGIMNNIDELEILDSGHVDNDGNIIYNIGSYKLGFTTATKIRDTEKVAMYIGKYVTKELSAVAKNKKKYWVSKNLNIPSVTVYEGDMEELDFGVHGAIINDSEYDMVNFKQVKKGDGYIRYYELKKKE
ncbi:rolling circle replication-associated protein [Anaeromicropila populeti]|uniref:Replication-associated protein ORF2/G2P domain-containing protein n=1 Tax=Anaeromicropila populeti TaxID=37658 RepID=A0A1I6L172_9FIRM|nr:hypothetical protein [Anaeromicropila populeti]SFR97196.1 hypothetical protein SAMN05661086_02978 [Anaeromicropila populeti]